MPSADHTQCPQPTRPLAGKLARVSLLMAAAAANFALAQQTTEQAKAAVCVKDTYMRTTAAEVCAPGYQAMSDFACGVNFCPADKPNTIRAVDGLCYNPSLINATDVEFGAFINGQRTNAIVNAITAHAKLAPQFINRNYSESKNTDPTAQALAAQAQYAAYWYKKTGNIPGTFWRWADQAMSISNPFHQYLHDHAQRFPADLPNCSGGPVNMAKGVNERLHVAAPPPPPPSPTAVTPYSIVAGYKFDPSRTKGWSQRPRIGNGGLCMGLLDGPDGFIALQECNGSRHQTFAVNALRPSDNASPVANFLPLTYQCVHPSPDGLFRTDPQCYPNSAAAVQRLTVLEVADKFTSYPQVPGAPLVPYKAYVDRTRSTCMGFTDPVVGRRLRMLPCDVNNPAPQFHWIGGVAYDIVR